MDRLFREAAGRIVAVLTRQLGPEHLDLAEDAVQDAVLRALETWPYRGEPDNPAAWLMRVARNRALDRLRQLAVHQRKQEEVARELETPDAGEDAGEAELRLLLLCCHPGLPPRSRLALALKTVGGFGVGEIARAFLADPVAVAQMLVRAKRTLRERHVPFELPADEALEERLTSALETIYLLFNEGYSATSGDRLVRDDLCVAAIRFAELLATHPATARPEAHAVLALLYLQASRLQARVDASGDLLLLAEQDRTLWDRSLISAGIRHLGRSAEGPRQTAWHVEAAIAACHATAESLETTEWSRVLSLYDDLVTLKPTPVVRLNRAVALGRVRGPGAALEALEAIAAHPAMRRYAPFHAARAEFLLAAGDRPGAALAWREAMAQAGTEPERRFMGERLKEVT